MPEFVDKFISDDDPVEDTETQEDVILQDEEVPIENEIEEPEPIKRRVVGRIPSRLLQRPSPPPELQRREIIDTAVPQADFNPIPQRAQYMQDVMRQPSGYYGQQPPRVSPDQMAKDQVRIDLAYQKEYEKQMRREALRNAPRLTTSRKLLNVANKFATGDNTCQRITPMGGISFHKPAVNTPVVKKSIEGNWNNVIRNISPKGTGKINSRGTVEIRKKKNSNFFGL